MVSPSYTLMTIPDVMGGIKGTVSSHLTEEEEDEDEEDKEEEEEEDATFQQQKRRHMIINEWNGSKKYFLLSFFCRAFC